MTSTADMKRIMDMMAKVKHLSENAGTIGEAEAATEMLNRMLVKHNISMAEIKDVDDQDSQVYDKFRFDLGSTYSWRKTLLDALAKTTFCHAVFDHKGKGANIVGQKHNVTVIEHMYDYLVNAINRLSDEAWENVDPHIKEFQSARGWKYAFRVGAAQEVGERLRKRFRENMAEQRKETGHGDAIVLVSNQLNDALARYFPRLRSTRISGPSNGHGLGAGLEAGGRVNLDSQVKAGRMAPVHELAG